MNQNNIEKFNSENFPFYIISHGNDHYSLCYVMHQTEKSKIWQTAFDRYAESVGESTMEGGLYTHGSGYEWETVFKKAFEKEDLSHIVFDSEGGGFFCTSENLEMLMNLGERFYKICNDTKRLENLIELALSEDASGLSEDTTGITL